MKKSEILITTLLFALLLASPTAGKDAGAKCRISFEAEATDTVVLQGEQLHAENTGSGSFDLTFTEPGVYFYTISNGKKSYAAQVHVLYEQDTLTAVPVIYGESDRKIDVIQFQDPKVPPVSPGSMVPFTPVQTGDTNHLFAWWIGAALSFTMIAVASAALYKRRNKIYEK